MDTVEIYRKSSMIAEKFKENVEKELNLLQQEIESLKQWQEFYKTSGLFGQAALFEQEAKNLRRKILLIKKGVPYPRLSDDQMEVFDSIFDRREPAEEFSFQSMPSDVVTAYLEAKEYKEVGIFDSIEVAYYDDDPLLLGKTICKTSGNELYYLIARWGDGLKPWEWFTNHYVSQKRALIPSLRMIITLIITSAFLLGTNYFIPITHFFKPIILTLGVSCLAVSAGSSVMRFKNTKHNSRILRPIPSPFVASAH